MHRIRSGMVAAEFSRCIISRFLCWDTDTIWSVNLSAVGGTRAAKQSRTRWRVTHCTLDTDFQGPCLILPGISIRMADSLMIPEKVTAVWAHNKAGMPADHSRGYFYQRAELRTPVFALTWLVFMEDCDGQYSTWTWSHVSKSAAHLWFCFLV